MSRSANGELPKLHLHQQPWGVLCLPMFEARLKWRSNPRTANRLGIAFNSYWQYFSLHPLSRDYNKPLKRMPCETISKCGLYRAGCQAPTPNHKLLAKLINCLVKTSNMYYTGSCCCGKLKYFVDLDSPDEARTSICHCKNCQVSLHNDSTHG
jgi:hypothetical protein